MIRLVNRHRRLLVLVVAASATLSLALSAGFHARGAYRYLNVFQEVWGLTRANYVEKVDEDALLVGAYRGMLASLDAASAWVDAPDLALMRAEPGPARGGLEVLLSGGIPVVVRVDDGGPASLAGLERGDQIWRIDGRPTRQLAWPLLDRMLRGDAGREVKLVILDASRYKLRETSMTLAVPEGNGFELEIDGAEDAPVALLRVTDAERVDPAALSKALGAIHAESPAAPLLVDLRGQVSVDPDVARRLAAALVPRGDVLVLASRDGESTSIAVDDAAAAWRGEMFILVDGGTAGAAEGLAAVARERAGARLCGRKTYGLAGVPELISLTHGGNILLTTREMRTPAGSRWAPDGLEPDEILVPPRVLAEDGESTADPLLGAALEWVRGEALDPAEERPAA